MKPLELTIRGKVYRIRLEGMLIIGVVAVLLIILLIALLTGISRKPAEPEEELPEETVEPEEVYDVESGVLDEDEYEGTVLAKTEDGGEDYIERTLFLGDSNTARFLAVRNTETGKTFTTKSNTIGVVGMGIDAISSFPCMDFSTGRYSMPASVAILQPERVIITMGTNNLSGSSTETESFINRYETGIKAIQAAYPSVDIIVNSIPPIAKTTTYINVKMVQIDAYNKAIADMCQENDWKYLNSAEVLKDKATGYAKDGYMVADGLHLSEQGLRALFEYIRTHTWITEDDRPKPLASIPNIIGVPDGLIKTDPLTNAEFEEDPSSAEFEAYASPSSDTKEEDEETEEPKETSTPSPAVSSPVPSSTTEPVQEPSQSPESSEQPPTESSSSESNEESSDPSPAEACQAMESALPEVDLNTVTE